MPKRSQAYRDARRDEILAAAKRCFVRNGFHETSMQDLFAEAGLSAGAVYSYFASKDEVILAIVEANMSDVLTLLNAFAADPHRGGIGATLASVLDLIRTKNAEDSLGPLALLMWAEVLRNPTLSKRFVATLRQMRGDLAKVVAERQQAGSLPADATPDGFAGLLFAIIPGLILQMTLLGDESLAGIGEAAEALWPT
jgi:AcrR family transcriptional regulator